MLPLLIPLLLILSTTTTTTTMAAPSQPRSSFGPPISLNLTDLLPPAEYTTPLCNSGFGVIDPGFNVQYQFAGATLRPLSCLINAVSAMSNLALQDFNGNIGPVVAQLPNYPDVKIRSIRTMPARYVIWGIWLYALFAMRNDWYQTVQLTLRMNTGIVGYIVVEKPNGQVLSLGGSDDDSGGESLKKISNVLIPATSPSLSLTSLTAISNSTSLPITNTTNPSNAHDLKVFSKVVGQRLTNKEFFKPILAGLEFVARFPSTSPVKGFKLCNPNEDTWIEFRDFGPRPRSQAPFFEYRSLAQTLGLMPQLMAERLRRWSEVLMVLQIDGINVADGWLRKTTP